MRSTQTHAPLPQLDNWFARDLVGLHEPWKADPVGAPKLLALNEGLATELGANATALRSPEGVALLVGNTVPDGSTPIAMAYAGHQFGGYSPRLGDGRALLLGEVTDTQGRVHDVHLKGSGVTPFARGGDGPQHAKGSLPIVWPARRWSGGRSASSSGPAHTQGVVTIPYPHSVTAAN